MSFNDKCPLHVTRAQSRLKLLTLPHRHPKHVHEAEKHEQVIIEMKKKRHFFYLI